MVTHRRQRALSTAASAIAAAIGLSRLLDRVLGISWLTAGMRLSTAIVIVLASLSLLFAARFDRGALRGLSGVMLTFIGVVALGGRAVTSITGGWPWFGSRAHGAFEPPSLFAGVIMLTLGGALLTRDRGRPPFRLPTDLLGSFGLMLSFVALTAFAHGATAFVPLLSQEDMGITPLASFALFALSLAILLVCEDGVASILFSSAPGAGLARTVTAVALFVPPVLGVLLRGAPQLGMRDVHARYAVLMVIVSAASMVGALIAANRLGKVDAERRCAEEALREAETSYRQLVRTAPDAILALDDGVVVVANARAAALFGRSEEALRGLPIEELIPTMPECGTEPVELHARTSLTGVPALDVPVEATCTGSEGGRRTVILRDISERRRTELATRRLAAIVESSNDAILLVDPAGMISAWNPGAERLFGWSAEEAIGQNLSLVIPAEREAERSEPIKGAAAGPLAPYETERLRRDGSRFPASISVSAVRDARHRLLGFSGVVRDISEQKRTELTLRVQETRFRLIFEHSADGIFVADLDARYADVNEAGCRMLRRTRDEIVGRTIRDFIRPEDFARLTADRDAILAGQTIVSEWPMLRGDGTWATIEVATTLLPDGRWLGVTRDVSARREQEDELRRLHEAERGLRRLREEWTAVVAHDLRAPVTSIAISAQMLARRELGSTERQLVQRIEGGAGRLRHMIDDLLDYAQIEAGRLRVQLQHVDLVALLSDLTERIAPALKRHRVQLQIEHAAFAAEIDPVRFDQVITNLVTNAAKYGDPDSDIEIRLGGRERLVEIAVTNRGPGMTEEEQQGLFDRFHRTPGATRTSIPGLGLGLFIVKGIVEAHGGHIDVESIPGQTTTFRVVLPGERHSLAA